MRTRLRSLIARPEREPQQRARFPSTAGETSTITIEEQTLGEATRDQPRVPGVRHPVGRMHHRLGLVSVVLVAGASITLIAAGGIQGASTSSRCVAQIGPDYDGVRGVCGIVEATWSLGETIVLLVEGFRCSSGPPDPASQRCCVAATCCAYQTADRSGSATATSPTFVRT